MRRGRECDKVESSAEGVAGLARRTSRLAATTGRCSGRRCVALKREFVSGFERVGIATGSVAEADGAMRCAALLYICGVSGAKCAGSGGSGIDSRGKKGHEQCADRYVGEMLRAAVAGGLPARPLPGWLATDYKVSRARV